jgi:protein subunit release factor B
METSNPDPIPIPETDDDLLRECEVETFRASGPGGQHVNKTESAVRLTHQPTGIAIVCRTQRSQYRNKTECLKRLRARLEKLNERAAPRVPTKITKGAKERKLREKARNAQIKKLRSKPGIDD